MVIPLSHIMPGESARIVLLANEEAMAGRLRGLGFESGVVVSCVMQKSKKNIAAYQVYNRVVSLREDDSQFILVEKIASSDDPKPQSRMDRFLTAPFTGGLCMLLLLAGILWITIAGANVPSAMLSEWLFDLEERLVSMAVRANLPEWFINLSIYGIYRVVAWIISVTLPPMAIFFPLFTLLEDVGYLPRISYNMDGAFQKCSVCGKQCLTMAMGLGCNAAGVTGCQIIDSPRERLIAILTNSLMPCNGRFPLLIMMISFGVMQVFRCSPVLTSSISALLLTAAILLAIAATLVSSWFLSRTLLKGLPSSFALELPPYRRPDMRGVLVRSFAERTLPVQGRAILMAVPAGLLIWVMANIMVGDRTLLLFCSGVLDPIGQLMGLDGVILMAFLLGFPANEIVLPIILMAYLQSGQLTQMNDTAAIGGLLASHGWTLKTFVCMALFALFHWPCSTTCLTIKKETGSWKWTIVAFLLPTLLGFSLCTAVAQLF